MALNLKQQLQIKDLSPLIKKGIIYHCTSTTRPPYPFENQLIFETDTGKLYYYNLSSGWTEIGGSSFSEDDITFKTKFYETARPTQTKVIPIPLFVNPTYTPIFSNAGNCQTIVTHDNKIRIYYFLYGNGTIYYRESSDGETFGDPVSTGIYPGASWTYFAIALDEFEPNPNKRYKIWYSRGFNEWYYRYSADGTSWSDAQSVTKSDYLDVLNGILAIGDYFYFLSTFEGGSPYSGVVIGEAKRGEETTVAFRQVAFPHMNTWYEANGVDCPRIIYLDGNIFVFYTAVPSSTYYKTISVASVSLVDFLNGKTFEKSPKNPLYGVSDSEYNRCNNPNLVFFNNRWRMYSGEGTIYKWDLNSMVEL